MPKTDLIFKKDIFKENRGTWSRFYDIFCRKCSGFVTVYQKDGPGELRRMYLDRIISIDYSDVAVNNCKESKNFICPHCSEILGVSYIYQKENRIAMRLFVGAVTKKLHKRI